MTPETEVRYQGKEPMVNSSFSLPARLLERIRATEMGGKNRSAFICLVLEQYFKDR